MVLTSLQHVFKPCPPTGWKVWNASPTTTELVKGKICKFKDKETGKIFISPTI